MTLSSRFPKLIIKLFQTTAVGALVCGLHGTASYAQTPVFVNEFHYDNEGADANEFIEIAGPAGTNLAGWQLSLYNGNGGTEYSTIILSGTIEDAGNGFGTLAFFEAGIQNGSPDGA